MDKYYNDIGLVGIVLTNMDDLTWSSGLGDSKIQEALLFDPYLVEMVLDQVDYKEIGTYCIEKWGICPSGFFNLRVDFIPPGTHFIIMTGIGGEYLVFLEKIFIA